MTLCTFTHMVYDSSSLYPQPVCHEFNQESEAKLGFKLKYRISTQKSQISEWSSYIQVLTDVAIDFANAKRICTKYIWHQKWLHDHRILSQPLISKFIARHIFWVLLPCMPKKSEVIKTELDLIWFLNLLHFSCVVHKSLLGAGNFSSFQNWDQILQQIGNKTFYCSNSTCSQK